MKNQINEPPHKNTLSAWLSGLTHLWAGGILGGLGVLLVALVARRMGVSADIFTREPQVALGGAWYIGTFSNLGGLIWFATAGILSFAACFKSQTRTSLAMAALVTWAMGVDDIFMLHDFVYTQFYIREVFVYAAYFGTTALIVLRFRNQLERSTLIGVTGAVFFWVLSAVLDKFFNAGVQLREDGAKFIGITIWAAAWAYQAYASLTNLLQTENRSEK